MADANELLMNRFEYLKELETDFLLQEREYTINEIESLNDMLDQGDLNPEQRSEFVNSDLPFEKDKLEAINIILQGRGVEIRNR